MKLVYSIYEVKQWGDIRAYKKAILMIEIYDGRNLLRRNFDVIDYISCTLEKIIDSYVDIPLLIDKQYDKVRDDSHILKFIDDKTLDDIFKNRDYENRINDWDIIKTLNGFDISILNNSSNCSTIVNDQTKLMFSDMLNNVLDRYEEDINSSLLNLVLCYIK